MTFAQPFRDYEILDRVGAGATGPVFKARQLRLGRIVALKVLRPSLARDTRYVERLRREARIVAALSHPNIVTGYDLGEEGGYHFFVMEFVEGRSLRALLFEWGIFPEDEVRSVVRQVAAALDHAFSKGVIHRDIKPGNILIDDKGAVKVTDMGLAKGPADLSITRDGSTVGTPQYIAPEQAKSPQDADIRSDLYSLGATLYHMATGQPPFQGTSVGEVIAQVLHETPISPRVINPELSEGMSLVARKLLSKSPKLRYQTPRELLDDLDRLDRDQRPQVDESRLVAGESDRSPRLGRLLAIVAAATALAGGGFWIGWQGSAAPGASAGASEFATVIDAELANLELPGQRWLRFLARVQDAPEGSAQWRQERQRELVAGLQAALDVLVTDLLALGISRIAVEAEDPQRWAPGMSLARDHVLSPLARALGLPRDQLPASVDTRGLDKVLTEIEEIARRRDQTLSERALRHLDVELPLRAEDRLRQGDYSGAERVWREGYLSWFDGLRQPTPDRLAATTRLRLEDRFERARDQGLAQVDVLEKRTANALRNEATDGLAALRAQATGDDRSPRALEARIAACARLREQLIAAYPPSSRFRTANDPWHELAGAFASFDREQQVAFEAAERTHEEQLCDLAWRAFVDGDAAAGLAVLAGCRQRANDETDWIEPHRVAMRAAEAVARAVVSSLSSAPPPIPGYPRNGGVPVELRASSDGSLEARIGAGHWRAAQLSEFRFGDLWRRALQADGDAMSALSLRDLAIGRTTLAMASDQLESLGEDLQQLDVAMLRDEIWPRLLRIRNLAPGTGEDRATALQRLQDAFTASKERGDPSEAEAALSQWELAFGLQASDAERAAARQVKDWAATEAKRQRRLADLQRRAPDGATIEVAAHDGFRASIRIPPQSMNGAGEGWQLREGRMEHVGASADWAAAVRRKLELDPGLGAACRDAALECEFAVAPSARQQSMQVFEFQGAACVVFTTGDGLLRGGIVQGPLKDAESVQSAVVRALHATIDRPAPAPRAIPSAFHLLRFSMQAAPGRRASTIVVSVDGIELCRAFVDGTSDAPAKFALYPVQDVSLRSVRIAASE